MKKTMLSAMLFATLAAGAVNPPMTSTGAEPPRRQLRPYATVEEAAANVGGESRYIVPLAEWRREESGETTRFSAEFVYPAAWLNRQILVRIESASTGYSVEVDGKFAGETTNGAAPAEFNVTKLSQQGLNTLTIALKKPSSAEPLLRENVAWLGRTEIVSQPTIRIRDIDTRTTLNDSGDGVFEAAVAVKSDALNPKQARISYELAAGEVRITGGYKDVKLSMRGEDTVRFAVVVPREYLWSADSVRPSLLTLTLRNRIEGRYAENIVVAAGAREEKYDKGELRINGKPVALKVKNVSPNISVGELASLKAEGFNAVTVAAGDAAEGLYSACDSAGVYVVAQLAADTSNGGRSIKRGGNAVNDPSLTAEYLSRVQAMYRTARSHPSVVAYSLGGGVVNGINAYESYLLLKALDPLRPVFYEGAGREWNSDPADIRTERRDR